MIDELHCECTECPGCGRKLEYEVKEEDLKRAGGQIHRCLGCHQLWVHARRKYIDEAAAYVNRLVEHIREEEKPQLPFSVAWSVRYGLDPPTRARLY